MHVPSFPEVIISEIVGDIPHYRAIYNSRRRNSRAVLKRGELPRASGRAPSIIFVAERLRQAEGSLPRNIDLGPRG
jgi:hypothetical protein